MSQCSHTPWNLYNNYTEGVKAAVIKFNEGYGKPHLQFPMNFQAAETDFERVSCLLKVLTGTQPLGKIFRSDLLTNNCQRIL